MLEPEQPSSSECFHTLATIAPVPVMELPVHSYIDSESIVDPIRIS